MELYYLSVSAVLGLCLGSFLNCMAWRLYEGETLGGRSHCRSCNKTIAWYDNIPILSFFLLKARCRHCHDNISWQYPMVEFITGLLFVLAFMATPFSWIFIIRNWFIISVLVLIFIMDARWYVILDKISIPSALIILGVNIWLGMSWQNLLISATIGTGFFLIQYLVSRGRWIGGGDIRLGFLLGVALGWPQIVAALFLAYGLGAVYGIILLISKKKTWGSMVAFGTCLSVAGAISLLYGTGIVNWYLSLINWH